MAPARRRWRRRTGDGGSTASPSTRSSRRPAGSGA